MSPDAFPGPELRAALDLTLAEVLSGPSEELVRKLTSYGETYHAADGCHWGGIPHLGPCRDRSREAGNALTEVRTVMSRAETALLMLLKHSNAATSPYEPMEDPRLPKPPPTAGCVDNGEPPRDPNGVPFDDPDLPIMVARLRTVVKLLRPWARAGKTTHWVRPEDGYAQLVTAGDPDLYAAEVGDEMFSGEQAALAIARKRLAERLAHDPDAQAAATGIMDELMREMFEEQREHEDDGEGG